MRSGFGPFWQEKKRRERVRVLFFPLQCAWAGMASYTTQLISMSAPAGAAEKPIYLTPKQHKQDIRTLERAGHLAACQKS